MWWLFLNGQKKRQPGVLRGQSNYEKVTMVQKILNKIIGAKYITIARTWVPNMVAWGTVGGVALIHFTDWRLVLAYVPYIRGKFKTDE